MINEQVGSAAVRQGVTTIHTRLGAKGHAIYGPYDQLQPGRYRVEFQIRAIAGDAEIADCVCALLDVTTDSGRRRLSHSIVFFSELDSRTVSKLALEFEIDEAREVEYRVHVNGTKELEIVDAPLVDRVPDASTTGGARSLPEVGLLLQQRPDIAELIYDMDGRIDVLDRQMIITLRGIRFNAKKYDDINFVNELFSGSVYNFSLDREVCAIDVGMNVALTTLLFAAKTCVCEVHSFEPFAETYDRGLANLALNQELAGKVHPLNIGLSDRDEEAVFLVRDTAGDSGAQATCSVEGGRPVSLVLRDAGETLKPIVAAARARNRRVVAKIDCEGAEFEIFPSLERAGLLDQIDFFMVEWHIGRDRQLEQLTGLLRAHGFLVVDLSPPDVNGFFYAARLAS